MVVMQTYYYDVTRGEYQLDWEVGANRHKSKFIDNLLKYLLVDSSRGAIMYLE